MHYNMIIKIINYIKQIMQKYFNNNKILHNDANDYYDDDERTISFNKYFITNDKIQIV
jgi:hypothetical protein